MIGSRRRSRCAEPGAWHLFAASAAREWRAEPWDRPDRERTDRYARLPLRPLWPIRLLREHILRQVRPQARLPARPEARRLARPRAGRRGRGRGRQTALAAPRPARRGPDVPPLRELREPRRLQLG